MKTTFGDSNAIEDVFYIINVYIASEFSSCSQHRTDKAKAAKV